MKEVGAAGLQVAFCAFCSVMLTGLAAVACATAFARLIENMKKRCENGEGVFRILFGGIWDVMTDAVHLVVSMVCFSCRLVKDTVRNCRPPQRAILQS